MGKIEILDGFDPRAVRRAASLLRGGEVVAFPTETVYGLGADAYNAVAVAKVFELKKRPRFDPLIVHISRTEMVEELAESVPPLAHFLMDRFWPGPLTIILRKNRIVPDIVSAGLPTVAIRMPNHPVAVDLLNQFGRPVAAPSANPFGYVSTTRAVDVADLFDDRLPLVLDGGQSYLGIESTIVSLHDGKVVLHRHGSVSLEELSAVLGNVIQQKAAGGLCESPGELPYHYAPLTPLIIISGPDEIRIENSAYLSFMAPTSPVRSKFVKILSPSGDLREAAMNFFSHLIEMDRIGSDVIYAQKIPEKGLGKAMMERLRKAGERRNLAIH
jgi:L-threonylcarbamoyladenylate synthase